VLKKSTSSVNTFNERRDIGAFLATLQYALRNRLIVFSCLISCMLNLSFAYLGTSTPLFSKYVLNTNDDIYVFGFTISAELQNAIPFLCSDLAALVSIPISLKFMDLYTKERVYTFCAGVCIILCLLHLVINSFLALVPTRILLGGFCAVLFIVPEILLADAIQQDSNNSGVQRSGSIYGFNSLLSHVTSILQELGKAMVLSATNYVQPTDAALVPIQPLSAIFGIRCLVGLVPALFLGLSIWVLTIRTSMAKGVKRD